MRISSFKIDNILKYTSIMSLAFYIGGIIYNISYYESFNIDILSYINWSESLLLFIPFLIGILILSIGATPLLYYIFRFFILRNIKKELLNHKEPRELSELGFILFGYLIMSGLLLILKTIFGWQSYYLISLIFPLYLFHSTQLILTLSLRKSKQSFTLIHFIPLFIILYASYLFVEGNDRAAKVHKGYSTVDISFTWMDTTTIKTGIDTVLIGQSREFVFLYDKRGNTSTAYARSKISKIDIKSKQGN